MKRDARSEGLRWLEQAEADRGGGLRLADQVLHMVREKLPEAS